MGKRNHKVEAYLFLPKLIIVIYTEIDLKNRSYAYLYIVKYTSMY